MSLQDKVALVTGGNSGIGRGIVHRFVREGARVAFTERDQTKGDAVLEEVAELGGDSAFFALDLAEESAVADLIENVRDRFGRLDIVVNNAGVGARRGGVEPDDTPGRRWQKLRGPNLDSGYFVCAHACPCSRRLAGAPSSTSHRPRPGAATGGSTRSPRPASKA